jgi:glycosyltransferase involved in cell wall biosynthesis
MLQQTIGRLCCRDRIRLVGPIYGDIRFSLLSIASVFITLSKNEGLPVAVLEALASGVPVVVTLEANLPEIAEYDAGVIVERKPMMVAAALLNILDNENLRDAMSIQAKRLVGERFSSEVVLPRLLALYRSLVSGKFGGLSRAEWTRKGGRSK